MSIEVEFVLVEVLYGLVVFAELEILEQTFEEAVSDVGRVQAWQVCSASDSSAAVSASVVAVVISGG